MAGAKKESETQLRDDLALQRTILAGERNQMAAERTFSAWIRTGLGGLAGGFALIRLITFKDPDNAYMAHIAGIVLLIWGIAIFIFAFVGYHKHVKKLGMLMPNEFAKKSMVVIAASLIILSFVLLVLAFFS